MERRRALLQLQQAGLGRKDRSRSNSSSAVPRGAALALAAILSLLLILVALGFGPSSWGSRDAAVHLPSATTSKPSYNSPIKTPQMTALLPETASPTGGVFSWLMVTAAAGSLFVVVFLRLGGSLSAGAPAAAPLPPQRNAGLGGGAATTTNINTTDASKPGDLTLLRVDVRGAIKEEVSGSGSRLNYVPSKLALRALGSEDVAESSNTPSAASPMGGRALGAVGNAWSNARSLLDFTSPSYGAATSEGYNISAFVPQDSSLLTPGRGAAAGAAGSMSSMSIDASAFPAMGSSPQPMPTTPATAAGTPISPATRQVLGSGSRIRYRASPSEPSPATSGTCRGGYARTSSGGAGLSPLSTSRVGPVAPVTDCLRYLDIDYLNDQYIINLRGVLGTYLQDCIRRFDSAVSGIVTQLVSRGKLPPSHSALATSLLGHAKDREPSPLIGGQGPAEFTLSDVLKFCNQPDVRPLLIIPSKGGSSIDLNTEYNQAVCLFRLAGDRFTSSAPGAEAGGNAGGNAGKSTSGGEREAGAEDGLADYGVSRKVFSRAGLYRGASPAGLYDGTRGSSSSSSGGSSEAGLGVAAKPSQQQQQPYSSSLLIAEGDTHRCTSYIISRCRELAADNHFGDFKWQGQQRSGLAVLSASPASRRPALPAWAVSDAEIIAATFLHFCDASFSPLAVSDDHRFSSARFIDASAGTPLKLPPGKADVCLIRTSFSPTHFNVAVADPRSHALTELAVEAGRQNVFEAVLLFLLVLQQQQQQQSLGSEASQSRPGAVGKEGGVLGSGPGSASAAHVRGVLEDVFGTADPLQRLLLRGHHYQDDLYR